MGRRSGGRSSLGWRARPRRPACHWSRSQDRVAPEARALYSRGLTAAFSLADGPRTLADCEEHAADLLSRATENAVRLWLARPTP